MKKKSIYLFMQRGFVSVGAAAFLIILMAPRMRGSEMASATVIASQVSPGENQYSVTVNDTGATTVGTLWFSWVPGDNFMPVAPTNVMNATGWQNTITSGGPSGGFAIQWTAVTPADNLGAGSSLSGFSFESPLTVAQLEAAASGNSDPVDTIFIYSGAPFSDNGFQLTPSITSAAPTPTVPEPAGIGLSALGLGVLIPAVGRKILRAARRA
jgi:hypothetical protein